MIHVITSSVSFFVHAVKNRFVIFVGLYLFILATVLCTILYLIPQRSHKSLQTVIFSRNNLHSDYSRTYSKMNITEYINVEDTNANLSLQLRLPVVKFNPSFVPNSRSIFISAARTGRLGNHLFQFASGYGISRLLNRTFTMGTTDEILKVFTIKDVVLTEISHFKNWQRVHEIQCCAFDETVLQRADRNKGNTLVAFSLQSWKYFAHVVNEIKMQLQFQPQIQEKANDIMRHIFVKYSCSSCHFRNEIPVYIGVHVRRGDMAAYKEQKYRYITAPIEYIYRAMNYYIQLYKKIIFIVCSDDMVWTKNVFRNSRNINVELVHDTTEVDLAVLASCNHSIITVGTFGWWAGFLTGGQVIHYKHQAREGTILRKGFSRSMDDYFLPHWISIS